MSEGTQSCEEKTLMNPSVTLKTADALTWIKFNDSQPPEVSLLKPCTLPQTEV